MNSTPTKEKPVHEATQLRVANALLRDLDQIMLPPYVGVSQADRVEYAVAHFIEEFRRARKPADTRK